MLKVFLAISVFVLSTFCVAQVAHSVPNPGSDGATLPQPRTPRLAEPHYHAEFPPIIANGFHGVSWSHGRLASFGMGEMKEPVTLYDKNGKWLFETWPTFKDATKVFAQDAAPTGTGTVVLAASAASGDGAVADMIVEVGADGVRRAIRTNPFFPLRVCATDGGTVWAYGKEFTPERTAESRSPYPMLREYSFEKGELRTALDRATVRPPRGVPVTGAHNDAYLQCAPGKVVLVLGSTNELLQYNLTKSTLVRSPIATLPEGFYMTGAAVTHSGEVFASTFRPGSNALTGMLHLHVNSAGAAQWTSLSTIPSGNQFFLLLGSDGEDLVYSRGRRSPAVFWSKPMDAAHESPNARR